MKAFLAAMSVLALSSPAFAQENPAPTGTTSPADATPSAAAHPSETNAQGERLICRASRGDVNSRMGARRICKTAEEWRAINRANAD
ncbi:MAG TPA: hypothetical protein VLK25_09565 [Allosphingosinicella sp.]|nr:hypothetical protein [Allosphingosinicella sp.]